MTSLYDNFLEHLEMCQGCVGPRKSVDCSYRVICGNAERLTHIVKDAEGLRAFGSYQLKRKRKDFEYPRRVEN